MTEPPCLGIHYSAEFDFSLTCTQPEDESFTWADVRCRLLYAAGHFECLSTGLLFAVEDFSRFGEELQRIQQGATSSATLSDVNNQLLLEVRTADQIFRKVHLTVTANENVAGTGVMTARFTLDLDYDLYVNRLFESVVAFVRELRDFVGQPRL